MTNLSLPTKILNSFENSSSIAMFARDTGGCLISKLALSRSREESIEIGFAELSESALFYFSAPAAAKATSKVFSKIYDIPKQQLSSPVTEINRNDKNLLKRVKLGKFGQIAATFSLILPLVFAIAPMRNLMTLSNSGKEKFTSVVGLQKDKSEQQKKEAKEKAVDLTKKLVLAGTAGLSATAVILASAKNKNSYRKLEPFIDKVVHHLDFTKDGDLKLAHYGALIYPVSIASYFYASRDKYEKRENARRFATTVPLMFFGEKIIERPIHKTVDKIFKTKVIENNKIKSYKDIFKMPLEKQTKYLKSKNLSYGLTFIINTMAISAAISLLNRIKTKQQYLKEEHEKTNINVQHKKYLTDSSYQIIR